VRDTGRNEQQSVLTVDYDTGQHKNFFQFCMSGAMINEEYTRKNNKPRTGGVMLHKTFSAAAIFFLLFLCSAESFAGWNRLMDIHKSALSDALKSSPAEFKNYFDQHEKKILSEVVSIHGRNNSEWYNYQVLYKTIVANIKENDPKRLDTTARFLTNITMYIFQKYAPIAPHEYVNQEEILKKAYVIYEGYDKSSQYASFTNTDFEVPFQYPTVKTDEKILIFYNKLVNEIINLWASTWNDAGKDMSGLPQANTSIRGNIKNIAKKPDTKPYNIPTATAQDNTPTLYSDAELSKYRRTSDFIGTPTYKSWDQLYSTKEPTSSASSSLKQTSEQCSKCDVIMEKTQKMIDSKDTGISDINAMIDLANTCYASCRGTERMAKQTTDQCLKCDAMMEKAQKMIDSKDTGLSDTNAMIDLANTCYASCRGTELPMRRKTTRETTSESNKGNQINNNGINPGAINTTTGEFYPGAAGGDNQSEIRSILS